MNILEGRCILVPNSGVFLMVILIFGLINVSQASAETQDSTPAPPNAKSLSKDGERYAKERKITNIEFHGYPGNSYPNRATVTSDDDFSLYWLVIILVIVVIGGCIGLWICGCILLCNQNTRQNQQGMVYAAQSQVSQGHQYYGQARQMPMTSLPQNRMPNGQGLMPMTSSPQNPKPNGQGQIPLTSSPQNRKPDGQV